MKFLIVFIILVHTINCSFDENIKSVCEGKKLSDSECKKYTMLRTDLQNCFEISTPSCSNEKDSPLHEKICLIQLEVKCFKEFQEKIKKLSITNEPDSCAIDAECQENSFCSRPRGILLGECKIRKEGFCRDNSHCPTTSFCKHVEDSSHGQCKPDKEEIQKNFTTPIHTPIQVFQISAEEAEEFSKTLEYIPPSNNNPLKEETRKGRFEIDMLSHESQTRILENARNVLAGYSIPSPCGYYTCDNPSFRNTYTARPNLKFKIIFVWYSCITSYNIKGKAALQTAKLNQRYSSVGISFISEVRVFGCKGNGNIPVRSAFDKIQEAVGSPSTHGSFAILIGKVTDNSWAFHEIPGVHGFWSYGAMDDAEYPTQTHELGHGFGLYHTFDSNPDSTCTQCYERDGSDGNTRGDFCTDTPAHVAFEGCATTFKKNGYCGDRRTSWTNPATNFMSYGGSCRKQFSSQQIMRMRCYAKNHLKTLKLQK